MHARAVCVEDRKTERERRESGGEDKFDGFVIVLDGECTMTRIGSGLTVNQILSYSSQYCQIGD